MPAARSTVPAYVAGLLFAALAVAAGIRGRRVPGAASFLAAWGAIAAGLALTGAAQRGWLHADAVTAHALVAGAALGLLLLSVALAGRDREAARKLVRQQARALADSRRRIEALKASERVLAQDLTRRNQQLEAANRSALANERQMQCTAHYDPLTGLANKLLLGDRIARSITRSKRHNCRTAVVLIDFDGFERINARFGTAAGDEVLKAAGARLRGAVREQDTVARPGGDKFVIVLEEIFDEQDMQRVATAAVTELAQAFDVAGHAITVGASIGYAIYPDGGTDADALLLHAEKQLRRAKASKNSPSSVAADALSPAA